MIGIGINFLNDLKIETFNLLKSLIRDDYKHFADIEKNKICSDLHFNIEILKNEIGYYGACCFINEATEFILMEYDEEISEQSLTKTFLKFMEENNLNGLE